MLDRDSDTAFQDLPAALPLDCHGVSVAGAAHSVNQDDYVLAPLGVLKTPQAPDGTPAFLFAVADGIGGGPAGDRASSLAIQTLHESIRKTASQPEVMKTVDPVELLRGAVLRCHEAILADVEAHPELFGMGTTLTAALVLWPTAWVVHAGDSRCYRLRGPRLERLTLDHTLVQRMSDEGILSPEAARRSRWRHALWNHLGKRSGPVDPEVISADLDCGDALLLTTDGITDPLPEREMSAIAAEPGGARSVSRKIVGAAEEKGGRDDMTLIFARFAKRA
jgi:PPM family protein phosphatase